MQQRLFSRQNSCGGLDMPRWELELIIQWPLLRLPDDWAGQEHGPRRNYEDVVGVEPLEVPETDEYTKDQEAKGERCPSPHDALTKWR